MSKQQVGQNISYEFTTAGKLTIEIDVTKEFGRSKSGKTITVGTTRGNVKLQDADGNELVLGINCYKYPDPE